MLKMKNLQIRSLIIQTLTVDRRHKLICLLLAVLVWVVVAYAQRREQHDEEWGLDNIRLSVPE